LEILGVEEEKHPEKRFKATFEAFSEKREPMIKIEYPKLKRSQRMQMLRKEVILDLFFSSKNIPTTHITKRLKPTMRKTRKEKNFLMMTDKICLFERYNIQ
jgi:hypothetical protein